MIKSTQTQNFYEKNTKQVFLLSYLKVLLLKIKKCLKMAYFDTFIGSFQNKTNILHFG